MKMTFRHYFFRCLDICSPVFLYIIKKNSEQTIINLWKMILTKFSSYTAMPKPSS